MFRLAVASDSHGDARKIRAFARIAEADADAVCHLGDYASDAEELAGIVRAPVYFVRGNCDLFRGAPIERLETFAGVTTYLCHGHALGVKDSTERLAQAAVARNARIALFGHTHSTLEHLSHGVLLINPGALKDGKCAFVDIDEKGAVRATFLTV